MSEAFNESLSIIKYHLWGQQYVPSKSFDFGQVMAEMQNHAIGSLILPVLELLPIDSDIKKQYNNTCLLNIAFYLKNISAQKNALDLLDSGNIKGVVLKGSAAAVYYPRPDLRSMGDVDILVKESDFESAIKLLLENGYAVDGAVDYTDRNIVMHKSGVKFEIHRYFSIMNCPEAAQYLENYITAGIDGAQTKSNTAGSFTMLPELENGLVLLQHLNQHFRDGLGLRHLIDWMMYVSHSLDDEAWGRFQPIAEHSGLEKLAVTVTRTCQMYLGLPEENISWCSCADENLCRALIEYVEFSGNFGYKNMGTTGGKIVNVSAELTQNPIRRLKTLQKSGLREWELARKYAIARPFAWIYKGAKYVREGLGGDGSLKDVRAGMQYGKKIANLMDELGVATTAEDLTTKPGERFVTGFSDIGE